MLRTTIRSLSRNPGFAVVAVATLALGIGGNTAMFSLVNGILLKPLAYREPDRLVSVSAILTQLRHLYPVVPVAAYHVAEWRKQTRTVEEFVLLQPNYLGLTGFGDAERISGVAASPSLFRVLGVEPQLGRGFVPEDELPGNNRVVILSDGFWLRKFARDPKVLETPLRLGGENYRVIGIMPASFPFPKQNEVNRVAPMPDRTDLWMPLTIRPEETHEVQGHNYSSIARLRPGVAVQAAEAELTQILARLPGIPKGLEAEARVAPLQMEMVQRARSGLIVLMAAIGAVLLIACINLTNLLLTRGLSRRRELGVRTALGATRARLCAALIGESAVLAGLGAAVGVLATYWLVDAVKLYSPIMLPRIDEVAVDLDVLLFAVGLTVVCTLACGLAPAVRFSAIDPVQALKEEGRGSLAGRGVGRFRSILIACETGACVVLLVAAGLFINSFLRIASIDQGFSGKNVYVAEVELRALRYNEPQRRVAFFQEAIDRLARLPGVESASAATKVPLAGPTDIDRIQREDDHTPEQQAPTAEYRIVTPGYFATIGLPILRGSTFEAAPSRPVAIVSQRTAERLWPGEDAIGKRFRARAGEERELLTVVGVATDIRTAPTDDVVATVYLPFTRNPEGTMVLVARTTGGPPAMRDVVKSLDATLPLGKMASMEEIFGFATAVRRFQLFVLVGFATVALLLACVGIYGVVSYAVAQRKGEMGLRMALGADRTQLIGMVVKEGMKPVLAGVLLGLVSAGALSRFLVTLLYEVRPTDPVTYATAAVALALVAFAACWIPARSAVAQDPMVTLRTE